MKKRRGKTGSLINEIAPKLHKKTRKKTNYLYIAGIKNLQNLAGKTG